MLSVLRFYFYQKLIKGGKRKPSERSELNRTWFSEQSNHAQIIQWVICRPAWLISLRLKLYLFPGDQRITDTFFFFLISELWMENTSFQWTHSCDSSNTNVWMDLELRWRRVSLTDRQTCETTDSLRLHSEATAWLNLARDALLGASQKYFNHLKIGFQILSISLDDKLTQNPSLLACFFIKQLWFSFFSEILTLHSQFINPVWFKSDNVDNHQIIMFFCHRKVWLERWMYLKIPLTLIKVPYSAVKLLALRK